MTTRKNKHEWFVSPIGDAKQVGRNIKFIWGVFFGKNEAKSTNDE